MLGIKKFSLMALGGLSALSPSNLLAQGTAADEFSKQANEMTSNFMEAVGKAFKGDAAAQEILLKDYLANALLVVAR